MITKLYTLMAWAQEEILSPFIDDGIWFVGQSIKRLVGMIPYLLWLGAPITHLIRAWADTFIPLEEVQSIMTSISLIIELTVLLFGFIFTPMTMLHWLLITNSVVYAIMLMRYGLSHAHMKGFFEHMLLLPTPITHAVRSIFLACTDSLIDLKFLSPFLLIPLIPESILILTGMIFVPLTTLNILLYLNLMVYAIKLSAHCLFATRATIERFASQLVALSARYRKPFATITVVLETACNAAVLGTVGLLTGMTPLMLIETLGLLLAQSISRKCLAAFFFDNHTYYQRIIWRVCVYISILSLTIGTTLLLGKLGSSLLWGVSLSKTISKLLPILQWTGILSAGSLFSLPGLMSGCLSLFHRTWDFTVRMFIRIDQYFSYQSMIRREQNLFKNLKYFDAYPRPGSYLNPLIQYFLSYSSYIGAIVLCVFSLVYAFSWVVVWSIQSIPYLRLSVYWLLHPIIASLPFLLIFLVTVTYLLYVSTLWLVATAPMIVDAMYQAQLRLFDWMVSRYVFRDTLHKHKQNLVDHKHIDIPKNKPVLSEQDKKTITQVLSEAKSNAYTLDITHTDSAPYLSNGYLHNSGLKAIFVDLSEQWPNATLGHTQNEVHWCFQVPPCNAPCKQAPTQQRPFPHAFKSEITRLSELCHKLPDKQDLLANTLKHNQSWLSKKVGWHFQKYQQQSKLLHNFIVSLQNTDDLSYRKTYERNLCSTLNQMVQSFGRGFTDIQKHIAPQMENPLDKLIAYYKDIPSETRLMANFSSHELSHLLSWTIQLKNWPEQLLLTLKTYNDKLVKKHYQNPQKIGARIAALITKLGHLPKSITLIGSNGGIAGERISYRAQIMNAIRKNLGNDTIPFRPTQSLKQIAHVLCPKKNEQGKLIARAKPLDVENITRKIATFCPLSGDDIKQDKNTWQDQALKDFGVR